MSEEKKLEKMEKIIKDLPDEIHESQDLLEENIKDSKKLFKMERNHLNILVWFSLILSIISIIATYVIVDIKTKQLFNNYLSLEYAKVWGKENYELIKKISLEQIKVWLEQYKQQGSQKKN